MRYTTLIDISEVPEVYCNMNARLLYLHMVLKSGYHDEDRDTLRASFRQLAAAVGLTLSATRHALRILGASGLIQKEGEVWRVKKWIVATPPTPRTQKNTARAGVYGDIDTRTRADIEAERHKAAEAFRNRALNAVRECTPDELRAWLAELKEGKERTHHNVLLPANKAYIEWLTKIVEMV